MSKTQIIGSQIRSLEPPWGPIFSLTAPPAETIVSTTLNQSGVTGATTSITVASSSGVPSTPFLAVFASTTEAFKVTNVSGTTWTIVRSQNGISAQNIADGTTIAVKNWIWINEVNGAYVTDNGISHYLSCTTTSVSGQQVISRVMLTPSTPYHYIGAFYTNFKQTWFTSCGLYFRESSTGKGMSFEICNGSSGAGTVGYLSLLLSYFNSSNVYVGNAGWWNFHAFISPVNFFRIGDNGTNITLDVSPDGIYWTEYLSHSRTTYFTTAPDQVGFCIGNSGAIVGCNLMSWQQTG